MSWKQCVVVLAAGTVLLVGAANLAAADNRAAAPRTDCVDFRHAPPWWQTAICLPDDPEKTLVGKEGQVMFEFQGKNLRDFAVIVQPDVLGGTRWQRQQTRSPRAPIVETRKDARGIEVLEEAFVVTPGTADTQGDSPIFVERKLGQSPPRQVILLVTLKNPTAAVAVRQPLLRLGTARAVTLKDGRVAVGENTRISASEGFVSCTRDGDGKQCTAALAEATIRPGKSRSYVFFVDRNGNAGSQRTVAEAAKLRDAAVAWWEHGHLPFGAMQVPDAGIQGMLDSCVRNIWQAREIKGGRPAYHVGPTVYRGLWVVDGSFLLESAALVGRPQDARAGVEYLLSHQKPDGSFEILSHYWKENGIVLWAATRHAMLTQDKAWLRGRWPALRRVVQAIGRLRAATLAKPDAPERGLLPAGSIDGGLSECGPEFSNTYWCLGGLKSAIAAARWLGETADADAWQKQFDDFYATFRKAAERDTRRDGHGNAYVPTVMGNAGNYPPQKGQWAFCHAVYPGQIFPAGDPLVAGQLAMFRATKVQGMVFDTGWMKDGLWTYFASFYGHALLWEGEGREAAEVLYDFANHAAPTRVWREEQKPDGRGGDEVGDMPHNWASAEFIRLATHLVELDRGDTLHLLEGLPRAWTGPGMVTQLRGVATPFGPLAMELKVADDGKTARLSVEPLRDPACTKIVVHLGGRARAELSPAERHEIEIPVR
ncbi:MAG: hypothetical protein ABSG68_03785 [Thermoguttaceae bacterium]|jgi:hypothetical protein